MIIRRFRADDAEALLTVFLSSVHQLAQKDYTIQQINAWAPPDLDLETWRPRVENNRPFVIDDQGRIIAFADLQSDGYIDQFFVDAPHGRKGVGTLLMNHLIAEAKRNAIASMWSNVSTTAEPFFSRFGFVVEQRQMPVVSGIAMPNARMRKSLHQAG